MANVRTRSATGLLLVLFGLFGCSRNDDTPRFVTQAAFQQNLGKQKQMSPMTLAQLHKPGVTDSKSLKLEFFFYTDAQSKAEALAAALKQLQYDAQARPAASGAQKFVVTGWSTPIKMREAELISWTEKMCEIGFAHDAEFDGWGTSPE